MNYRGFSLVESLIGLAIGTVILLGALALINSYYRNNAYTQAVTTRDSLIAKAKSLGSSLKILQTSARASSVNQQLWNCLYNNSCTTTVPGPLALYEGGVTGTAFSGPAVGSNNTPVFYNIDGSRCTPTGTVQCPLEVTTSFVTQCPANPPANLLPPLTCGSPPDIIQVTYNIQQVPGVALGSSKQQLAPYSGTIIVKGF